MSKLLFSIIFFFSLVVGQNAWSDEAIPFTERNGLKYVTAYINGSAVELVFDTGSNKVVLNSDGLLRIGMSEFDDSRKTQSHTAGGVVGSYMVRVNTIGVGNIRMMNYEISYVPTSTGNLLGASFFAGYSYFVDEDNKVIRLIPKGGYSLGNVEQPPAVQPLNVHAPAEQPLTDHHLTDPGRIEIEVEGEKYIYPGGERSPEQR